MTCDLGFCVKRAVFDDALNDQSPLMLLNLVASKCISSLVLKCGLLELLIVVFMLIGVNRSVINQEAYDDRRSEAPMSGSVTDAGKFVVVVTYIYIINP